ncbi:MAG: SUMF1/EgtB/PvdO family nonheme iron enzyme [Deltaproteobacteria bacterium]|nr:SUMF1/EgtB/PvdO family nonheme iron enzyme [Deltaproteobacteria bacterium]
MPVSRKLLLTFIVVLAAACSRHPAQPTSPAPSPTPQVEALGPSPCPPDMAYVPGGAVEVVYEGERWGGRKVETVTVVPFCVDRWEASHPDATESSQSPWTQETARPDPPKPLSREGVLPLTQISQENARIACRKVDKRLPTLAEWQAAFSGATARSWPWGDDWAEHGCHATSTFGVKPTGACCFPVVGGRSDEFVCDMVGNVSEWIDEPWDEECYGELRVMIAGGAAHLTPTAKNAQKPDDKKPGCWLASRYGLDRTSLHQHFAPTPHVDDGFRCAKDLPPTG